MGMTFGLILLQGCGTSTSPTNDDLKTKEEYRETRAEGKIFGDDFLRFNTHVTGEDDEQGIGVNAYLWKASLSTVSFMPLKSADPFGGVIMTEWYTPPETPGERIRVDILILDRRLRTSGIKASVFKQVQNAQGHWIDTPVDPETARSFEDAILTKARQLKRDA